MSYCHLDVVDLSKSGDLGSTPKPILRSSFSVDRALGIATLTETKKPTQNGKFKNRKSLTRRISE